MRTVLKCAIGRWVSCGLFRGSPHFLAACAALIAVSCGSSGSGSGMSAAQAPPPPPAMAAVTMVVSSTANDQLSAFDIVVQGVSLTSASGKTVSVLSQERHSEFMHVNGAMEPLLTASIPQDTYTAATITVGGAWFTCVALQPEGGLDISTFAYGQTPTADVSVTLPTPIVVSGDSMGLSLNLMVSQSASYSSCAGGATYAITPNFSLGSFAYTSPVTSEDGGVTELNGQVTALDSDSRGFDISLPTITAATPLAATSVHIVVNSTTAWQGVSAFADLQEGTFVDLDGAIQGDGSIAATRVAIADLAAVNVQRGPLLFVSNAVPILDMLPRQAQGKDEPADYEPFNFDSGTFRVSGAFPNLQALPFTPSFNAQNMVPGQAVYISSPAFMPTGAYLAAASTVTLMPQTVNGTVVVTSTSGDFTVYSVSLPSYDLFPLLATQPGQTSLLSNPSVIEMYADTSTVMLTASAPAVGDTLRFYGLVFNDHGTLRMDCAQISPGVAAVSP